MIVSVRFSKTWIPVTNKIVEMVSCLNFVYKHMNSNIMAYYHNHLEGEKNILSTGKHFAITNPGTYRV